MRGSAGRGALVAWAALALLVRPGPAQQGEDAPAALPTEAPERRSRARLVVVVSGAAGEEVRDATVEIRPEPARGSEGPAVARGGGRTGVPPAAVLRRTAAGRYASAPLAPGRYRVRVTAPGYAPWAGRIGLAPGERARLEARLTPSPLPLADLVARVRWDPEHVPPGHSVDRIRFGTSGTTAATLGEWLDGLPGVDVRRRGAGGRQVVAVRGSRPEGFLVLLDGAPLNDPLTGAADLSGIPTATLESATLVRGAWPDAGPGALGGVLLLRSRTPDGTAVTGAVEAGSFGRIAADLHASAAGEAGSLALTGRYEESRNDYSFRNRVHPDRPVERRRNADVRGWHGALAAVPAALPLALRLRADRLERGTPGRMGTRLFDQARWEDASWQAALEARPGARIAAGGAARFRTVRYRDPRVEEESRHATSDLRFRARIRPDRAGRWEAAARLAVEEAGGDRLRTAPARPSVGLTVSRRVGANPLELRPALAFDAAAGATAWSPSLAATARPGPAWDLWARAGRAFRPPTFSDLYFASARGVRPNPDLRPERVAFDGELGATWRPVGGRLRLRAAGFVRVTESPIVWLPSSVAVWSPRNLERLTARGAELDLTIEPGRGWALQAAGTAEASRLGSGTADDRLPYVPALRGRIAVERRGSAGAARAELRAVGARTTTLAGTHRLPPFAVLDVTGRAGVEVGGIPLELRVGVRNVLDATYELVELFPEPGRSLEARLTVGPLGDGRGPAGYSTTETVHREGAMR